MNGRRRGEKLPEQILRDTVRILGENRGNVTHAALAAGVPRGTFQGRVYQAETAGYIKRKDGKNYVLPEVKMPKILPAGLSPAELIEQASARFEQSAASRASRNWMEIGFKSNDPVGVCFMGDPHVDSPGCNWPLLKRHIELLSTTPGMYGVNLGDLTDNWVGRLVRLYADSHMTKSDGWRLAKYLLSESGIHWLCILKGNHDAWNDGGIIIDMIAPEFVPVENWAAKFKLVFPNGSQVKISAAHNFPGHSMWNPQHGLQREMLMGDQADIYAAGDHHTWAVNEGENAKRGANFWLVRSRGYKMIDEHATELGFTPQQYGASVTAIIEPDTDGTRRIRCFPDLEEAAEFLTWKRSRK